MISRFLRAFKDIEISLDVDRLEHLPEGPLKRARFELWKQRKKAFTMPKPDTPAIFVAMSEKEIVELLGGESFEPGWELSYNYHDEELNLRRVEYVANHPDYPHFEWWQVHIRGYLHEKDEQFEADTFELAAHFEVEPREHPDAYDQQIGIEIERGTEVLMSILDAHGIKYEFKHPDGRIATLEEGVITLEDALATDVADSTAV